MGRKHNFIDVGRTSIPQEYEAALDVAYDLGIECVEPEALARWATPAKARYHASRIVKSTKGLTFDTFCSAEPIDWCIGNVQAGSCIRNRAYWLDRLRRKVVAATCDCDSLRCRDCNTGGRPVARCRDCANLTGWEKSPEGQHAMQLFLKQLEELDGKT